MGGATCGGGAVGGDCPGWVEQGWELELGRHCRGGERGRFGEKKQGLVYGWGTGKGGPKRGRCYVRKGREVLRCGGATL